MMVIHGVVDDDDDDENSSSASDQRLNRIRCTSFDCQNRFVESCSWRPSSLIHYQSMMMMLMLVVVRVEMMVVVTGCVRW